MQIGWRFWVLIIAFLISLLAIRPSFDSGVIVKSVEKDSSIAKQGLQQGELIIEVNGNKIETQEDYSKIIEAYFVDGTEKRLDIKTEKNAYTYLTNQTPEITTENL